MYLAHINGHYSRGIASITMAASWPYELGIIVDLPANRTLEHCQPRVWNVTGAVPEKHKLVGM
jgi:hypothetical protein